MLINEGDDGSSQPFANLLPIVEALTLGGNATLDSGFVLHPDGWRCRMSHPIDFDVIESRYMLPPSIVASREWDSVLDQSTWVIIEGPNAAVRRGPSAG